MRRALIVGILSLGMLGSVAYATPPISDQLTGGFVGNVFCGPQGHYAKVSLDVIQETPYGERVLHRHAFLGPAKTAKLCG